MRSEPVSSPGLQVPRAWPPNCASSGLGLGFSQRKQGGLQGPPSTSEPGPASTLRQASEQEQV